MAGLLREMPPPESRHLDQNVILFIFHLGLHFERDIAFDGRGRARVLQEMDEDLLQGFAVGVDGRHDLGQIQAHGNVLLAQLTAGIRHGIVNDDVQVHGFQT